MDSEKKLQDSISAVAARLTDRLKPATERLALPALLDVLGQEWDCLAIKHDSPLEGQTQMLFRFVPDNDFFVVSVNPADWAIRQTIQRVF
jgi:hypothetical protein